MAAFEARDTPWLLIADRADCRYLQDITKRMDSTAVLSVPKFRNTESHTSEYRRQPQAIA